jgi:hypothetical protein
MTYRPILQRYDDPALEAELAHRRDILGAAGRGAPSRRGAWWRNRRRPR